MCIRDRLAVGGILSRSLLFVLISLVSSIYFLRDAGKIGAFCLRFVPEGKREECSKVAAEINGKFGKYIAGQFLLMAIMAVLAFAILCFYHVKYALIVALLAGVLEIDVYKRQIYYSSSQIYFLRSGSLGCDHNHTIFSPHGSFRLST